MLATALTGQKLEESHTTLFWGEFFSEIVHFIKALKMLFVKLP